MSQAIWKQAATSTPLNLQAPTRQHCQNIHALGIRPKAQGLNPIKALLEVRLNRLYVFGLRQNL